MSLDDYTHYVPLPDGNLLCYNKQTQQNEVVMVKVLSGVRVSEDAEKALAKKRFGLIDPICGLIGDAYVR